MEIITDNLDNTFLVNKLEEISDFFVGKDSIYQSTIVIELQNNLYDILQRRYTNIIPKTINIRCADGKIYEIDSVNEKDILPDLFVLKDILHADNYKDLLTTDISSVNYAICLITNKLYQFKSSSDRDVYKYLMDNKYGPLVFEILQGKFKCPSIPDEISIFNKFLDKEPFSIKRMMASKLLVDDEYEQSELDLDNRLLRNIIKSELRIELSKINEITRKIDGDICYNNDISLANYVYRRNILGMDKAKAIELGKNELYKYGLKFNTQIGAQNAMLKLIKERLIMNKLEEGKTVNE